MGSPVTPDLRRFLPDWPRCKPRRFSSLSLGSCYISPRLVPARPDQGGTCAAMAGRRHRSCLRRYRAPLVWLAVLAVIAQAVLFDLAMAARETTAARASALR